MRLGTALYKEHDREMDRKMNIEIKTVMNMSGQ